MCCSKRLIRMATLRDFTSAESKVDTEELFSSFHSLLNAHTPSCLPFTKSFLKFQLIMVNNIFGRN